MAYNRRQFLTGVATTTIAGASLLPLAASASSNQEQGMQFLRADDDLQSILDAGQKLIMLHPNQEYVWSNITIPSGTTIIGNGSTVRSGSQNAPVLRLSGQVTGISIIDVNFDGNISGSPYHQAVKSRHIGIEVYKGSDITIENCSFRRFLGAGVSMFNYHGIKRAVDMKVSGCRFIDCQYGWVAWYNCEYGILSNNHFTNCRVAIWNCSGNWVIQGNVVVDCRASYVVTSAANEIAFSTGGNFSHGNVTGNTFNHSNQSPWPLSQLKYGNTTKAVEGVYFDSVLPVTFTGNALWYTNFTVENTLDDFYLTGCTFSNGNITNGSAHSLTLTGCWVRPSVRMIGDVTTS